MKTYVKINSIAIDQLLDIFNYIQDVQFWIKDKDFRYIIVNSSFLDNYAIKDSREFIGKTDYDITPPYLADQFRMDDIEVLKGKSILNRVELVGGFDQVAKWFLTSKRPLYSPDEKIIGTIGIKIPINKYFCEHVLLQERLMLSLSTYGNDY